MECPRCDVNMKCSCRACLKNDRKIAQSGVYQVSEEKSDLIACGNCGLKAHIDEWSELEMEILYEEVGGPLFSRFSEVETVRLE